MKSILEYISNYWENKAMINESFKSSILQEIAKQFNDRIKANKEYNKEKEWNYRDTNSTFKLVFGSESIKWSEITDDMFTKYSKDDEEGEKLVKRMMGNRANTFSGMAIILNKEANDDNNRPKYLGALISIGNSKGYVSFLTDWRISYKNLKPSDALDYLRNDYLLINLSKHTSFDIEGDRSNAKWGAYLFADDKERNDFYKKIAEQNIKRYKNYLIKVKAEREANDGITEKVEEYSKKIFNFTLKISNNPIKYAKYEYEIGGLVDYLRDERKWVSSKYAQGGGYYSGKDGLLTAYKSYLTSKLAMGKGYASDSDKQSYENAKARLNKIFNAIDAEIQRLEDKMNENK